MSHEVIFDKLYPKDDRSLKSFDLTDSLISGLCSNSSRPNESERNETSNDELKVDKYNDDQIKSDNLDDQSYDIEPIKPKVNNDKMELTDDEFESIDDNFTTKNHKLISKPKEITVSDKNSTKKSSSYRSRSSDKSHQVHIPNILPARADPFVYDRKTKTIRYNFERCISADSALILGGNNHRTTLDAAKSNLIVGQDNTSELHGSFIVGEHNKIKGKSHHKNNTIIGDNNELHNTTNSSIIGCSGVKLKNCRDTIALGITATDDDEFPEDLNQTLLVRNLHVAGSMSASNIKQNSVYVKGDKQRDVFYQITRGDGIDIVYANPTDGTIWIQLGVPRNVGFEANRTIVIKDVTLEAGNGQTSHNINIIVPPTEVGAPQTRIEYYNGKLLAVSTQGGVETGYVLNTAGGSVTYRYAASFISGQPSTWVIQSQFLGNMRTTQFRETDVETRSKLIKKY